MEKPMEFFELPETEQQALKRAFPDHPAIPQLGGSGQGQREMVMIEVQDLFSV